MTCVSLEELSVTYAQGTPALRKVSLTVGPGELMVLLGPSGSGKTTVLRAIAGLLRPSAGDVRFDGRSVLETPPEKRGAVMVFQEHALFPFMDVGANVAFGLRMRRVGASAIRAKVSEALAAVQLEGYGDRRPDELSGGQRQRVALARALVIAPRVLLLDEPLSSLEPGLREELREVIRGLQQKAGITMLLVTHDQTDAVAVADRVSLLMRGEVRQTGAPRSFFERPVDVEVARFFGGINFLPGIKRGRVVETSLGPLKVGASDRPDGAVLLTIRPEAVEVGWNGHNNLEGSVESYSFQGLVARCGADVSNTQLQVTVPPYRRFRQGEKIVLHLPRERIHLLPVETEP